MSHGEGNAGTAIQSSSGLLFDDDNSNNNIYIIVHVGFTFALVARLLRLRRTEDSIWRASAGFLFFLLQLMATEVMRKKFREWIPPVKLVCVPLIWTHLKFL